MIKYISTAWALKCFSLCEPTKKFYRYLANCSANNRRSRSSMPFYYPERLKRYLELNNQFHFLKDGIRIIELGTGWFHWEALCLRLFYDVEVVLYDVWDNRQFGAFQAYAMQLEALIKDINNVSPERKENGYKVIQIIKNSKDFNSVYEKLGFSYVLEPSGTLSNFKASSFDLVVSGGVFEHLPASIVTPYIKDTSRILRPGGFAIHSINTTDHLYLYDRSASPKQYLKYSDRIWNLLFNNDLQYINRIQRCHWLASFTDAGFTLLGEHCDTADLTNLYIADKYKALDLKSLSCTTLDVILQKRS